ncbi:MAG TPA: hypothetical protein VK926_00290, partial [Gaiellaceae bacterium]|nr:hypothetical protein [Gaiellaceae bacterium]
MGAFSDARVALLERLIDHAPLFPPASLDLEDALEEDLRARGSVSSFVLARFVCPASRFRELPDVGRGVSVVLDGPLEPDARVEAVESAMSEGLGALASLADEVYVELSADDSLDERLDALASLGLRAKVRCGGTAKPSIEELARFVRACRDRGLVFKATAGLHRAIGHEGEHGFLNLLAAAVFGDEESALAETDANAFALDTEAFRWRGRSATADALTRARRERLSSIGSCSFFEPVA